MLMVEVRRITSKHKILKSDKKDIVLFMMKQYYCCALEYLSRLLYGLITSLVDISDGCMVIS
jgi:hypothetical protein